MLLSEFYERIDAATIRQFKDVRNKLKLLSSMLRTAPLAGITNAKMEVQRIVMRMENASRSIIAGEVSKLAGLKAALNTSHPQRVLERGYSMVQTDSGEVLSTISQLSIGQNIKINFADGITDANILKINKKK